MQGVMVDTSAWVAYFRGGKASAPVADAVDYLLSGDEALLDEVVLTELVPFFRVRGETGAEEALSAVRNPPLQIDWPALRDLQERCIRAGINKVGVPDLVIAQHAMRLGVPLFSLDRHFALVAGISELKLWPKPAV